MSAFEPTKEITKIFRGYEKNHQEFRNKLLHLIIVPTISYSVMGLYGLLDFSETQHYLGFIFYLCTLGLWYMILDIKIAVLMHFIAFMLYFYARQETLQTLLILQAIAWGLGFAGHHFLEENKPSVIESIKESLISPVLMLSVLIGYYEPKKSKSTEPKPTKAANKRPKLKKRGKRRKTKKKAA